MTYILRFSGFPNTDRLKKWLLTFLFLGILVQICFSQRYFTRDGHAKFCSEAPIETIEAVNNSSNCVLDIETGKLESAVLIKAFHFEKALMQQHFNENYMESNKYPKATFKGEITNLSGIDFSKSGEQEVHLKGEITIHGVTKALETTGTIKKDGDRIHTSSVFILKPADFDIKIPGVVRDNIAREIKVTLEFELEPYEKS